MKKHLKYLVVVDKQLSTGIILIIIKIENFVRVFDLLKSKSVRKINIAI